MPEDPTCFVSVTGTHLNIRKDVSPTVTHFFSLGMKLVEVISDRSSAQTSCLNTINLHHDIIHARVFLSVHSKADS